MHRAERARRHEEFWKELGEPAPLAEPCSSRRAGLRDLAGLLALSLSCGLAAIALALALRALLLEDGQLMSGYHEGLRFLDALPMALGLAVAGMPAFSLLAPKGLGDTVAMLLGWAMVASWTTGILALVF